MRIELPQKVIDIITKLKEAGFEAYAVGGCVRDSILGRMPDDWDITTSALPAQVKELFRRTVDTGIAHGTVTVLLQGEGFEVTTYRIDGAYTDSRHPEQVTFTASLAEDLKRRDFTINAMAYNEEEGLVDIFHGLSDIQRRMIRCVGCPAERFSEDALRMMRAVRFAAQLGYEIEEGTCTAIKQHAPALKHISAERIQTELVKLLLSPHPDYIRLAYELGVTREVLPEFDEMMCTPQHNPHHCYDVGGHTICALRHIRADKALRLAVLLHDVGKIRTRTTDSEGIDHFYGHPQAGEAMAREILRRLKLDNHTTDLVCRLVKYHDILIAPEEAAMRRAMNRAGEDIVPLLFEIKRADAMAQNQEMREEKLAAIGRLNEIYTQVLEKKQCVSIKTLAVSGKDLIAAGVAPGPGMGQMLDQMLQLVLQQPECNEKSYLLSKISDFS